MTKAKRFIESDELSSLATGAWILGAGGGGNPYHAYLNMRELYRRGTRVELMDPRELADDDWVACVSNMGAPLVGEERLGDPQTAAKPVQMMEEFLGKRFCGIMSLEIGGGNSIRPLLAASVMDLPVIDADCMGRAFPEAQRTSFAIGALDGEVVVMVPEIICIMDSVSGEAVGTETLRYAQRVSVVALKAPDVLMTEKGLEYVGPRAFGYDLEFRSVFV